MAPILSFVTTMPNQQAETIITNYVSDTTNLMIYDSVAGNPGEVHRAYVVQHLPMDQYTLALSLKPRIVGDIKELELHEVPPLVSLLLIHGFR